VNTGATARLASTNATTIDKHRCYIDRCGWLGLLTRQRLIDKLVRLFVACGDQLTAQLFRQVRDVTSRDRQFADDFERHLSLLKAAADGGHV